MEALVQEKILSSFVNEVSVENETIKPINVDIKTTNVTRMIFHKTMTTNDGSYFIKYGGYPITGAYNAIEVYSVNSLDNNTLVYTFNNLQIEGHTVYINELKQAEDGRFYGLGQYLNGNSYIYYLIILNNFIQDGYCRINKYYTETNMGIDVGQFQNIAKIPNTGIYFIVAVNKLIKFEINILEGNKTSTADIVDNTTITTGSYQTQLNVLKNKLIFTKLYESETYQYEYLKAVIDVNEELPSTVTLNSLYDISVGSIRHISGAANNPFEAIIPFCSTLGYITIYRVNIDGEVSVRVNTSRTFKNNSNLYAYLTENYASVTDNNNIYLMYFDENAGLSGLTEFYNGEFTGYYSNTQILKQNNIINLIGTAVNGTQQSIVSIKNIYSPNVTSEPYFDYDFCLPYYMNLYSNSEDDTSLIFSRDATARFYSGNQITSTFIVPNYLLNDGNIEKASVYGKTNYLLNSEVEDYQKNKFESLYFNFIYNLNVIDNTNGLNTLNQIGSNKVANGLWKTFDNYDLKLTKARITYEDLSTEIIELTLVNVVGETAIFNYNVNGNITQIEYLSNDESTVYATYKRKISGSHTITQVVKTIPNDIGTANGTSIYINDSSSLRFANIIIDGNTTQNGTPTPSNQVPINSAGDNINLLENTYTTSGTQSGITHTKKTDGTMLLNGTATTTVFMILNTFNLPAGTYILSGCPNGGSENGYRQDILVGSNVITRDFGSGGSFTLNESTSIQARIRIGSGTVINNLTFKPMIAKGSIATPYSPYGMGSINEVISNKNLFNIPNNTVTASGLTASIEDGIVSLGGTSTATSFLFLIRNKLSLKAGTYTISAFNNNISSDDTTDLRVTYRNGDGVIARAYLNNTNVSLTFTLNTDLEEGCLQIRSGSGNTFNNFVIKPQLELGSSATSFVPHQEQNISIPCQQPMRSIGNVRDSFVKQDGVWYEKHVIGQVVLNGSESWGFGASGEQNINGANVYISSILISNYGQGLCNYFIRGTSKTANTLRFGANDKQLWFYVKSTDFANVNDWKTWLSTHNTEVIYQLAEPIYLECTEEQITELEKIKDLYTYENTTNINSTDETPAYLNVTYYKQL